MCVDVHMHTHLPSQNDERKWKKFLMKFNKNKRISIATRRWISSFLLALSLILFCFCCRRNRKKKKQYFEMKSNYVCLHRIAVSNKCFSCTHAINIFISSFHFLRLSAEVVFSCFRRNAFDVIFHFCLHKNQMNKTF